MESENANRVCNAKKMGQLGSKNEHSAGRLNSAL